MFLLRKEKAGKHKQTKSVFVGVCVCVCVPAGCRSVCGCCSAGPWRRSRSGRKRSTGCRNNPTWGPRTPDLEREDVNEVNRRGPRNNSVSGRLQRKRESHRAGCWVWTPAVRCRRRRTETESEIAWLRVPEAPSSAYWQLRGRKEGPGSGLNDLCGSHCLRISNVFLFLLHKLVILERRRHLCSQWH